MVKTTKTAVHVRGLRYWRKPEFKFWLFAPLTCMVLGNAHPPLCSSVSPACKLQIVASFNMSIRWIHCCFNYINKTFIPIPIFKAGPV